MAAVSVITAQFEEVGQIYVCQTKYYFVGEQNAVAGVPEFLTAA